MYCSSVRQEASKAPGEAVPEQAAAGETVLVALVEPAVVGVGNGHQPQWVAVIE